MTWTRRTLLLSMALAGGCHTPGPIGVLIQDDLRAPIPWRTLTADEQTTFDLGHAVFNTQWSPAGQPAGRRDGLGPLFNSAGCDACHNSRRRGRGPLDSGEAPSDLVIQLGNRMPDGSVTRGNDDYGFILNTSALKGMLDEASVTIRYEEKIHQLADGSEVSLRMPRYTVSNLSGPPLPDTTLLMPRMPPSIQGAGLLELVPQSEIETLAERGHGKVSRPTLNEGIGRFGWQGTEPSLASQTATAFSREMGLTTTRISHIDCGPANNACLDAPNGGSPEVEPALFEAVVFFQQVHAVPSRVRPGISGPGAKLFSQIGCADCHRTTLSVTRPSSVIHPYTDLLLHDLGEGLHDRDIAGVAVNSLWRTAPLWGMQTSVTSGQQLRLLHDGRARSIEEAILWHDGEGRKAREKYSRLGKTERVALMDWIATL